MDENYVDLLHSFLNETYPSEMKGMDLNKFNEKMLNDTKYRNDIYYILSESHPEIMNNITDKEFYNKVLSSKKKEPTTKNSVSGSEVSQILGKGLNPNNQGDNQKIEVPYSKDGQEQTNLENQLSSTQSPKFVTDQELSSAYNKGELKRPKTEAYQLDGQYVVPQMVEKNGIVQPDVLGATQIIEADEYDPIYAGMPKQADNIADTGVKYNDAVLNDYIEYQKNKEGEDSQSYLGIKEKVEHYKSLGSALYDDPKYANELDEYQNIQRQAIKKKMDVDISQFKRERSKYDWTYLNQKVVELEAKKSAIDKKIKQLNPAPDKVLSMPQQKELDALVQEANKIQSEYQKLPEETGISQDTIDSMKGISSRLNSSELELSKIGTGDTQNEKAIRDYQSELEQNKKSQEQFFNNNGLEGGPGMVMRGTALMGREIAKSFSSLLVSSGKLPMIMSEAMGAKGYGWTDKLYEATDNINDYIEKVSPELDNMNTFMDTASTIGQGVGSVLAITSGGTGAGMAGMAGRASVLYPSSVAGLYDQFIEAGFTPEESSMFALAGGVPMTIVEEIVPDSKYLERSFVGTITDAVASGKTTKEAIQKGVEHIVSRAGKSGVTGLKESGEEALGQLAESISLQSGSSYTGKEIDGIWDTSKFANAAWGGLTTGVFLDMLKFGNPRGEAQNKYRDAILSHVAENVKDIGSLMNDQNPDSFNELGGRLTLLKDVYQGVKNSPNWNTLSNEDRQKLLSLAYTKQVMLDNLKQSGLEKSAFQNDINDIDNQMFLLINKKESDAVQKPSTEEVLPSQQRETTKEGGEREGMERSVQGQETSKESIKEQESVNDVELTDQEHANRIKEDLTKTFLDKGVPKEEIDAGIALMDARAKASGLGDKWFRKIDRIGTGDFEQNTPRLMQMPDGKKQMVMPIAPDVVNGFYSPIEKSVGSVKQEKWGSGKEAWGAINKGLKSDEVKWTGIEEWLTQQGKVTKQEILDYLKNNRVEIAEVVKGEPEDPSDFDYARKKFEDYGYYVDTDSNGDSYIEKDEEAVDIYDLPDELKIYYDIITRENSYRDVNPSDTKFSDEIYQLEGDKSNYKEILVTLPITEGKKSEIDRIALEAKSRLELADDMFNRSNIGFSQDALENGYSNEKDKPFIAQQALALAIYEGDSYGRKQLEDRLRYFVGDENFVKAKQLGLDINEAYENAQKKKSETPEGIFKSSHFEEPNILVHLRMNTRTDVDGNKILFLEEVQSDWGQEGKKDLFVNIPKGPFVTNTNAWTKLGLKIALREAVKKGANKIAWTTGEQQNERYDLSKKVDQIDVEGVEGLENVHFVDVKLSNGKIEKLEVENGIIRDGLGVGQRLDSVIGKEYADRVLSTSSGEFITLKGQDLKMGGSGMKGFYGSINEGIGIVGKVAKDLVKELTGKEGKIEETNIPEGKGILGKPTVEQLEKAKQLALNAEDNSSAIFLQGQIDNIRSGRDYSHALFNPNEPASSFFDEVREPSIFTQHSIEITPELKSAIDNGIPLFQDGKGAVETLANGKKVIHALKNPDFSTIVHELAHVFEDELTDLERSQVEKWARTKGWTIDTSEAFARGFERYLRNGVSPNEELDSIFARARKWLVSIYSSLKGSVISKSLSHEVRSIFDRLLSGELANTDVDSTVDESVDGEMVSEEVDNENVIIEDVIKEYKIASTKKGMAKDTAIKEVVKKHGDVGKKISYINNNFDKLTETLGITKICKIQ